MLRQFKMARFAKMQKKIVLSMAVVALLLVGVMATSVLATNTTLTKNAIISKELQATAKPETMASHEPAKERSTVAARTNESADTTNVDDASVSVVRNQTSGVTEVDIDRLRDAVPSTYEETDARVSTQRVRFLLYTHEGKHVMWGFVGNGHFVGTDNNGKRCWGIYGNEVFAGVYDGEFFWGKYRSGNWKAEGLFGLNCASGKYILFPTPALTADTP
jgi:hypothetical protein